MCLYITLLNFYTVKRPYSSQIVLNLYKIVFYLMQIIMNNNTVMVLILKFPLTNLEIFLQSKLCPSVSLQLMIPCQYKKKMLYWAQWDGDPSVQKYVRAQCYTLWPQHPPDQSTGFQTEGLYWLRSEALLRATKQTPQHKTKALLLFLPSGRCSPVVFKTVEMWLSELTIVQTALFNEAQLLERTEGRWNSWVVSEGFSAYFALQL